MTQAIMTRDDVRGLLSKQKDEFARALGSQISADYFIRVALTAINKQPLLLQCTRDSLLQCLMDAAQLGLETDSVRGLAYLVPFNDSKRGMICTLIIGFQGLIDLSYRHPKVKAIRYGTVRSGDRFDYAEGLQPRLVHVPDDSENPGDLTHAYAICDLDNGGQSWVVLNRRQVMKAKSSSRSASSSYSPWTTHEEAMWAKTAVRQLAKRVPKSRELSEALGKDDDEQVIDVQSIAANQAPVINVGELPPDPPTKGEVMAAEVRKEANTLTPEERAALEVKGREIIGTTPAAKPKKAKAEPAKSPDPRIVPAPVDGGTPPPDLFVESEDHVKLRALMEESGTSEGNFLEYARHEGLIEDHVNSLPMIPQKRVRTLVLSWDQIIAELSGKR